VAARLLGLRVRTPVGVGMSVSCECCVFQVEFPESGRSLVQGSTTERVCVCVCVCVRARARV